MIRLQEFKLMDKVVLGKVIFKPPFKASSALLNEARFVHVVHGKSRLYAPTNQMNMQTSDSLVMKCENFVNNWLENENGEPNEVIVIHFHPEILKAIYTEGIPEVFHQKIHEDGKPVEKIELNSMLENFVQSLLFYFENEALITEELIKLKLKELVLILINSDTQNRLKLLLGDLFRTNENSFTDVIHSHLFEDLSIQDLAFFTGMSLSSFKRKFSTVFGTSPAQYIKTKRLEEAQRLLKSTDNRISDIAFDCGFNDVAYFSKTFHSSFECSPSDYRKKYLV